MANSNCNAFLNDIVENYNDEFIFESKSIDVGFPFFIEQKWDENLIF